MSGGLGLRQMDVFYRMMNQAGDAPQAEDVVLSPAIQALVMQNGDEPIILNWSIATSGSLAIYEAYFQWDEVDDPDDRPEWRIILLIPDKDSEPVCYAVDALRMYINGYRRVANVRRIEISEALASWMWYWQHDTGEIVDPRTLIRPPSA